MNHPLFITSVIVTLVCGLRYDMVRAESSIVQTISVSANTGGQTGSASTTIVQQGQSSAVVRATTRINGRVIVDEQSIKSATSHDTRYRVPTSTHTSPTRTQPQTGVEKPVAASTTRSFVIAREPLINLIRNQSVRESYSERLGDAPSSLSRAYISIRRAIMYVVSRFFS